MGVGLERQHCFNHPERYGHAVCMSCGKVVCQECATRFDDINYCVRCLARRGHSTGERASIVTWTLVLAASAGLFYLGPRLMVWGTALMAG